MSSIFNFKLIYFKVYALARRRFKFNYGKDRTKPLSPYLASFYDAVTVYTRALNKTLASNHTIRNGSVISRHMWNHTSRKLQTFFSEPQVQFLIF